MPTQDVLVDSPAVDHRKVESSATEEAMTHAEKMNARFEAFKAETARMNRSYWASVRRAQQRLEESKKKQTWLEECPRCGRLDQPSHIPDCRTIKPLDITMTEKLDRKDDPMNDRTWDYDVDPHKIAEL